MSIKHSCPKCGDPTTIERTDYFITVACENCLEFWEIVDYEECCKESDVILVRFIDEGGKVHVRKQCKNCGKITNNSLPGFTPQQKSLLPVADKTRRELYQTRKWDLYKLFIDKCREKFNQRHSAKDTIWWNNYKAYLQSDKWKRKSKKVLERDNHLCQACLDRKATQAHHLSYEFVGHEPLFDLIAVCDQCHEHLHKIRNQRKAS